MHITVSVYKNTALYRRRSTEHPLFIGPLYVHGHSDADTYHFFFSHIAARLSDRPFHLLAMGSDEEQSMRKCMYRAFPGASFVTCHRHVKENAVHKLDSMVGKRSATRRAIYDALFGDSGLSTCADVISFDAAVDRLRHKELAAGPPEFMQHFERHVLPLLRANVVAGRARWTNNNCESINHVLKQYTQWKPQQVPELIGMLRELVTSQYVEADRALCGLGELMLTPQYVKHRTTADCWKQMTADQRRKASEACFRQMPCPSSTSTDGSVQVPMTSCGGKKPHQRRRQRAEKSTSIPNKPPSYVCSDDDFE